ncbi:hypothetical protein EBL84_01220 [Marichromatium sp. AB31]|nr:hypothetical protein EBL84_01220 [Marichromatium sp. AB31]
MMCDVGVRPQAVRTHWRLIAGGLLPFAPFAPSRFNRLVAGRWSLVAGRWSLVAGRWSLVGATNPAQAVILVN